MRLWEPKAVVVLRGHVKPSLLKKTCPQWAPWLALWTAREALISRLHLMAAGKPERRPPDKCESFSLSMQMRPTSNKSEFSHATSPRMVGKTGSSYLPARSRSQACTVLIVSRRSGVLRCLRPFPSQRTCAPGPKITSPQFRLISSETRRPSAAPGAKWLDPGGRFTTPHRASPATPSFPCGQ